MWYTTRVNPWPTSLSSLYKRFTRLLTYYNLKYLLMIQIYSIPQKTLLFIIIIIYYCSANKLSINFKKTNYMLITSRPRRNTLIDIPNITRTSCIKYLDVYIDEHLQWHVNSKIAKNIGILFKLRRYLNIHMLTNLYYTLIYPYLSYGLMSWGTTYKSKLNQLSSKLNKCVKCIFFTNRRENPSPYYKLLGILKLDN
jgi:hypothetical protein